MFTFIKSLVGNDPEPEQQPLRSVIDPIALAADKYGYKPDTSFMELNQAIRVLQQYHDLQRARQAKIKARLDMIKSIN